MLVPLIRQKCSIANFHAPSLVLVHAQSSTPRSLRSDIAEQMCAYVLPYGGHTCGH